MRVISLSALIAAVAIAAPSARAQSTTYTCKNGRVVATATECANANVNATVKKHKKHKKHHKKTSMTSNGEVRTTTVVEPAKPTVAQKVSHGVGEAGGDVSKLGKKAAHGVREAASDVKKAVTKKP